MSFRIPLSLVACLILLAGSGAWASDGIEKRDVQFAKGALPADGEYRIRGKQGDAEVHVLRFAGGKVSSEGAMSVKASKVSDTGSIEVNDDERSQIPEAVISGG